MLAFYRSVRWSLMSRKQQYRSNERNSRCRLQPRKNNPFLNILNNPSEEMLHPFILVLNRYLRHKRNNTRENNAMSQQWTYQLGTAQSEHQRYYRASLWLILLLFSSSSQLWTFYHGPNDQTMAYVPKTTKKLSYCYSKQCSLPATLWDSSVSLHTFKWQLKTHLHAFAAWWALSGSIVAFLQLWHFIYNSWLTYLLKKLCYQKFANQNNFEILTRPPQDIIISSQNCCSIYCTLQ